MHGNGISLLLEIQLQEKLSSMQPLKDSIISDFLNYMKTTFCD